MVYRHRQVLSSRGRLAFNGTCGGVGRFEHGRELINASITGVSGSIPARQRFGPGPFLGAGRKTESGEYFTASML